MIRGPARPTPAEVGGRTPGCLRVAAGGLVLAVLAPAAALVRTWRRWRCPARRRVAISESTAAAPGRVRLELHAEVPAVEELGWRTRLTDAVVRLAESLRSADDVYHLVYRVPGEPEAVLLAIGPQLQALGERFSLALGQLELEGRTAVWPVLPRRCHVSMAIDPFAVDPEADEDRDRLLGLPELRWGLATAWVRRDGAFELRLLADLPASAALRARSILARLESAAPARRPRGRGEE